MSDLLGWSDAAAEGTAHLAGGLARLGQCLGVDQIADGFGLGEVELAGEKRALGEFAGIRETRTERKGSTQQQIENHRRTVRRDLHEFVAGVRIWRGEPRDHRFVDAFAACIVFIEHLSEAGVRVLERLAQADKLRGDRSGLGTAKAYDTYSAAAGGVEMAAMVSTIAAVISGTFDSVAMACFNCREWKWGLPLMLFARGGARSAGRSAAERRRRCRSCSR